MRIGSRESRLFIGKKNVRNGVVVETNWDKKDKITHTIVDFAHHVCVYSLRTCLHHRDHTETRSQFYKDERPYDVFENVNFDADENNIVTEEVARNQKKWECFNMGDDVFAVNDVCVFSRDKPRRCYSELAGREVEYDPGAADAILSANVPFDCFLQFDFTKSCNLDLSHPKIFPITYRLHSVKHVNPDRFGLIFQTPWLKLTQSAYREYDPFEAQPEPEKTKNLPGIKAFALTGRKVYVPSRPRWRIFFAYKNLSSLLQGRVTSIKPHMPLLIDVRYCDEMGRFIVYDATRGSGPVLPATLTNDDFHKASLVPVPNCPGYFKLGAIGLVFDKYGHMAGFYFDDKQTKIEADFTYTDPDEYAYTSLVVHKVYDEPKINWKELKYEGLYIGNNEFYCQYLHFWILRPPADMELLVGKWYELTIENVHLAEAMADVDAKLMDGYEQVPHRIYNRNLEFLLDITTPCHANNRIIVSNLLGVIGATENLLEKCGRNITAVAVQFPLPEASPEDRPQIRPKAIRPYKNVEVGKTVGKFN